MLTVDFVSFSCPLLSWFVKQGFRLAGLGTYGESKYTSDEN